MNQLDQSRHIADGDMRQDLVRMWRSVCKRPCFGLLRMGGQQRGDILLGAGHDAIDEIHGRKRALEPLGWCERLHLQAQLYVLQHCKPGKERKGLEHDGDMRIGSMLRYPLEEHLPTRWR